MATLHKRNKSMRISLLPVLISVFILGWLMYASGDKKRLDNIQRIIQKKDNVIFLPIVFEEKREMRAMVA
jgi:hypothetical protein